AERIARVSDNLNLMCLKGRPMRTNGQVPRSDRVGHVDEDVADAEALGQALTEGPHAKGLGRVVAGGEEVDPGLARAGHRAFGGLAGDEGVEAGGDGVLEMVGPGA